MIVELFRATLDLDADTRVGFAATLSAEETRRAEAVQDGLGARRLTADYGWRRRLLAERLGCAPAEVEFVWSEARKPRLAGPGPQFSASRSDGLAWYAVSADAEVGVDVQRIDRDRPLGPLTRRLLSDRERALYEALPRSERAAALAACWCSKEAASKALGTGLVFPLTELEAWSADGAPVRADGLETHQLDAGEDRAAAVAVRIRPGEEVTISGPIDLRAP